MKLNTSLYQCETASESMRDFRKATEGIHQGDFGGFYQCNVQMTIYTVSDTPQTHNSKLLNILNSYISFISC